MNEALRLEAIVLDDQYLHHLREAAYDWAIESVDDQPAGPRRAAIVLGRNVVSLVDEVRRLRAERDMTKEELTAALGGALKECREHNGDYHWRTSDAVLDQWRQMLTRHQVKTTKGGLVIE